MDLKRQCYFIHGADTYRSRQALKAITTRFLRKENSMADFATFDMSETTLETLKATLLASPFFVTHRMFVLKHVMSAPKAIQEGVMKLLPSLSDATFIVIYEGKSCDKRLSVYQWLTKQAKNEEYPLPQGADLTSRITQIAGPLGVTVDRDAASLLAVYFGRDMQRLALEVQKLACAALSRGKSAISVALVTELCTTDEEQPIFALTDALRDGNLKRSVQLYNELVTNNDPMLIAGALGSQIRTFARLFTCLQKGVQRQEEIAAKVGLNPYVVKLALPVARTLTQKSIAASYAALIRFDRSVKEGLVPSSLGGLLLIVSLHGTLKR